MQGIFSKAWFLKFVSQIHTTFFTLLCILIYLTNSYSEFSMKPQNMTRVAISCFKTLVENLPQILENFVGSIYYVLMNVSEFHTIVFYTNSIGCLINVYFQCCWSEHLSRNNFANCTKWKSPITHKKKRRKTCYL